MADNNIELNFIAKIKQAINDVNKFVSQAQKGIKDFEATAEKTKGPLARVGDFFRDLTAKASKGFKNLSLEIKALVAGGVLVGFQALKSAVSSTFSTLAEFSLAVAEVRSIAPNTIRANKNLEKSFIELAAQFGTTAQEQAGTLYQIISAGITDAAKSQEALIAANKLAIGGLATVGQSVDILTTALNVYKDSNLGAEEAADVLFATVRLGKTNISELSSSLGNVLPIANNFGISFQEVSASIADLTAKGIPSTAQAVTSLRGILNGVIQAQSQLAKESPAVAEAFSINALRTKDFSTFLRDANRAVDGNVVKLKQLLGSVEGVTGFVTLASGEFQGLDNALKEIDNSAGAADKAFQEISSTLGFQLKQLKQNISNLVLRFSTEGGESLASLLKVINNGVLFLINNIELAVKAFRLLAINIALIKFGPTLIKATTTAMKLLTLENAKALFSLKTLSNGFKVFSLVGKAAILGVRTSLTVLKATATFGVSLILDAIITKFIELKEQAGGFINLIKSSLNVFGFNFEIAKPVDETAAAVAALNEELQQSTSITQDFNSELLNSTDEVFKIDDALIDTIDTASGLTGEAGKVTDAFKGAADAAKDIEIPEVSQDSLFGGGGGGSTPSASEKRDLIPPSTIEKVKSSFGEGAASIAASVAGFANPLSAFAEAAKAVVGVAQGLINLIPDLLNSVAGVFDSLADLPLKIAEGLDKLFASLVKVAATLLQNLVRSVGSIIKGLFQFLLRDLPKALLETAKELPGIISEVVRELPDFILPLFEALPDIITELVESLIESMPAITLALVDALITNGGAIRIGFAIAKAMSIDLPLALARGVVNGIESLGKTAFANLAKVFSEGIKFPDLDVNTQKFVDGIKSFFGSDNPFFIGLRSIFGPDNPFLRTLRNILDNFNPGNVVGGKGGGFVGRIGKSLGFAEGGRVPLGFPNDTFPARLTSGEEVIDRSTSERLREFLSEGSSNQNVVIRLQVGETELADVIYNLNRRGFRTA